MTMSKNLGKSICLVVVVLFFGCGGEDLSDIKPDYKNVAHFALVEYNENKAAFADKHENKVLQLYGTILRIDENKIGIYAGSKLLELDDFIGGIECRFSKHQSQINDLRKKNEVWIKGRFSKEEKVDGFILEDCYIVETVTHEE